MGNRTPDLIGWHVDAEPCLRSDLGGADCHREHVTDLRRFWALGIDALTQQERPSRRPENDDKQWW